MKSKLVSRNPIQRFKQGKSIIKAQYGVKTPVPKSGTLSRDKDPNGGYWVRLQDDYNPKKFIWKNPTQNRILGENEEILVGGRYLKGNGTQTSMSLRAQKAVKQKDGRMIYKMPDGTWRNEKGQKLVNFASHQQTPKKEEVPAAGKSITKPAVKNTSTATPPQSTVTPPPSQSTVQFTPGTLNNGQFTPTGETTTQFDKASLIPQFTPKPQETFGPGTFNTNVTYNSGNIRANRGVNYSNVNEYWDYLNNNRDSNDYKLFQNIMRTTDGNLNRDVFDQTMAKYGISGNLGRRDSGRLANLLNDLNLIGTEGSDARNSFIDSYNNHFNLAQKEAPVKKWTPQGQDWRSNLQNVLSLSYHKKGGTLSSRNPINRFKANFRLVAQ